MRYAKILFVALVAIVASVNLSMAQSTRYTIGDDKNNEFVDTVDFDRSAPILTESDNKLYYIRHINLHGVKYLNHDILKSSAGLMAPLQTIEMLPVSSETTSTTASEFSVIPIAARWRVPRAEEKD